MGCSLAGPRPRDVRRGHKHPRGNPWQARGLQIGPELEETGVDETFSFSPALGWMFMAHPHRWALAFLGFWVRQAPTQDAANRAAPRQLALPTRVAPSPSSRIGAILKAEPVADQRVSRKGLHYRGWLGIVLVAIRGGGCGGKWSLSCWMRSWSSGSG